MEDIVHLHHLALGTLVKKAIIENITKEIIMIENDQENEKDTTEKMIDILKEMGEDTRPVVEGMNGGIILPTDIDLPLLPVTIVNDPFPQGVNE